MSEFEMKPTRFSTLNVDLFVVNVFPTLVTSPFDAVKVSPVTDCFVPPLLWKEIEDIGDAGIFTVLQVDETVCFLPWIFRDFVYV